MDIPLKSSKLSGEATLRGSRSLRMLTCCCRAGDLSVGVSELILAGESTPSGNAPEGIAPGGRAGRDLSSTVGLEPLE